MNNNNSHQDQVQVHPQTQTQQHSQIQNPTSTQSQSQFFVVPRNIKPTIYGYSQNTLLYDSKNDQQEHFMIFFCKYSNKEKADIKISADGFSVQEDIKKEDLINSLLNTTLLPNHPHIPKYYGMNTTDTEYQLMFEYIHGKEMYDLLADNNINIDLKTKQTIFKQIVTTVQDLHKKGIVHLDLSIENIMIDSQYNVKIIDFGVAQMHHLACNNNPDNNANIPIYKYEDIEANPNIHTFKCKSIDKNDLPGKLRYLSPELFHSQPFDAYKNDIYSLGIILFLLLTRRPPYMFPVHDTDIKNWFPHIINGNWKKRKFIQENKDVTTHYKTLPKQALELMDLILKPEDKRLSIEQILQHPFFSIDLDLNLNVNVNAKVDLKIEQLEKPYEKIKEFKA